MCLVPVISGIGLVSPLAGNAPQTWEALVSARFITNHARTCVDAERPDRIHNLATMASREAIDDAGWSARLIEPARTALVVGTSKGAIETWLTPLPSTPDNPPPAEGHCAMYSLASISAHLRSEFPILDGPAITLSSACASGLHALIRGAMMIRSGEADRVLVVAAEASLHPLFLASFRRLGVLPKQGIGCRPFDQQRDGFLMSEAAAAVCLERIHSADSVRGYACIDRFALGGDATHMTGGDPDGKLLRRLLQSVIADRAIDLVQAHGTGTIFNDPIELAALDDLCRSDSPPAIYSHKGALGHSLGAAGLVSIVLNCLMHRHQLIPPNIQTINPIPTRHIVLRRELIERRIDRSIAIASGFGGTTGVVSLRSP